MTCGMRVWELKNKVIDTHSHKKKIKITLMLVVEIDYKQMEQNKYKICMLYHQQYYKNSKEFT